MKELKTGDEGKDVLNLKTCLNHFKFRDDTGKSLNLKIDLFDASIRQALKRYQRKVLD